MDLIVSENLSVFNLFDLGCFQAVKSSLGLVLAYAYARATEQQSDSNRYLMLKDSLGYLRCGQMILQHSGYIKLNVSGIYQATEKGIQFMEEHYSKQELWGVKVR